MIKNILLTILVIIALLAGLAASRYLHGRNACASLKMGHENGVCLETFEAEAP
jgi:hypothetical protein